MVAVGMVFIQDVAFQDLASQIEIGGHICRAKSYAQELLSLKRGRPTVI
jgi:hypothetical protein